MIKEIRVWLAIAVLLIARTILLPAGVLIFIAELIEKLADWVAGYDESWEDEDC